MVIYILYIPHHRHITIGLLFPLISFPSPSTARFLPPAHSPSVLEHNSHTSLSARASPQPLFSCRSCLHLQVAPLAVLRGLSFKLSVQIFFLLGSVWLLIYAPSSSPASQFGAAGDGEHPQEAEAEGASWWGERCAWSVSPVPNPRAAATFLPEVIPNPYGTQSELTPKCPTLPKAYWMLAAF